MLEVLKNGKKEEHAAIATAIAVMIVVIATGIRNSTHLESNGDPNHNNNEVGEDTISH